MRLYILAAVLFFSCATVQNGPLLFGPPRSLGLIDERLPEASGLAASVTHPGYLWSVNDGENPNEVFLIDTTARVKMGVKLAVPNRDWEEVAIGPGPDPQKSYVYVGEIGDNKAVFQYKYIYRFEEPASIQASTVATLIDTLTIQMPDGRRDTETLMIDPLSHDLYLISKREDSIGVYKVPYPFQRGVITAQKLAKIPFHNIVAGGFSPDGLEIILKDYDHIYYWKRNQAEALEKVLLRQPTEIPYERESQGESLAWRIDGKGFFTLSETNPGKPAYLLYYKKYQ